MPINYYLNDLFKQVEKFKALKTYIEMNKKQFLSEEIWKIELDNINKKINKIYDEIKSYN